jgi:hypothetical protein
MQDRVPPGVREFARAFAECRPERRASRRGRAGGEEWDDGSSRDKGDLRHLQRRSSNRSLLRWQHKWGRRDTGVSGV